MAPYGYKPNLSATPILSTNIPTAVQDLITAQEEQLQALKQHPQVAKNRMKIMADCKRTDQQFTVGNQVLLKLQPYTESSVASSLFPKLAFKYFGPYTVLERIGSVAYGSQIHLVFHILQLKPFTPDYTLVYSVLPKLTDLQAIETGPIQILEHRLVQKGGGAIPQVRVQWSDLPASATTWEDYYMLKERFPTALLGDKQVLWTGEMSQRLLRHKPQKAQGSEVMQRGLEGRLYSIVILYYSCL